MSDATCITTEQEEYERHTHYIDNLKELTNSELLFLHAFNKEGGWLDEEINEHALIRAEMQTRSEDMMGYVEGRIRETENG